MLDTERAWLAGLFEGEGCINIAPKNNNVRLWVIMTDRDVLLRVESLFPSPTGIYPRETERPRKTQYCWRIQRRASVEQFLALILPWLGIRRRAKAEEALAFLASRPGSAAAWRLAKTHCKHGHPLSGDNLYRHPTSGQRVCRTCVRRSSREHQRRRRAAASSAT